MDLLLNVAGALITKKAEVLTVFFPSVSSGKTRLRQSQSTDTGWKVWSKDLSYVEEDQAREHKLVIHKSTGPDRMHPEVPRQLSDITAECTLSNFAADTKLEGVADTPKWVCCHPEGPG